MDSLIAKADAVRPLKKKTKKHDQESKHDATASSIAKNASLPKSLRDSAPVEGAQNYNHIANKRLRTQLNRTSEHAARSKALLKDAELLLTEESGRIEVEGDLEKTWRVGQDEIVQQAGQEALKGRKEWRLDGGPYCSRYSRNGRHLAIAGHNGHVATFDWQTGTLHTELQLQETCRDITFLHDQSFFAVAQKKYVYIYDRDGVEMHRLKSHVEPTRLEFLPYHWLLVSVGNPGYLKYQDTSTGQLVIEHRTKLGACRTMTQNPANAVIHLGHNNGTVTLWTPNLPHPAVQLLAHLGPVASVSVDPSSGGRYMATAGQDGLVKVWDCRNWKGAIREWNSRGGVGLVEYSAKGSLAVASGGTVNIYNPPSIQTPFAAKAQPPLYLTHPITHRPLVSLRFAPFQDVLTVGHGAGLSNLLVPGAGEVNFDSTEADPFETKKTRREREVKNLLEKIQPDMISLNPEFVGSLAPPTKLTTARNDTLDIPFARLPRMERLKAQGKVDEEGDETMEDNVSASDNDNDKEAQKTIQREEREKKKMRGKNKSLKRYLRKHRKNVIDPATVAIRAKLEKQREQQRKMKAIANGTAEPQKPSALDRFKRGD